MVSRVLLSATQVSLFLVRDECSFCHESFRSFGPGQPRWYVRIFPPTVVGYVLIGHPKKFSLNALRHTCGTVVLLLLLLRVTGGKIRQSRGTRAPVNALYGRGRPAKPQGGKGTGFNTHEKRITRGVCVPRYCLDPGEPHENNVNARTPM